MKKAFLIIFTLFLTWCLKAQQIQLTLKPGSSPNKVIAVLRSDATFSGLISTVQVSFRIPKAGLSSRPGTILVNNFLASRLLWTPSVMFPASPAFLAETATDYYYTYNADASGTTPYSFTAGTEVNLIEVGFTGTPVPVNLRAVQLPEGGTLLSSGGIFTMMDLENSINFFISVGGVDRTNLVTQFYAGTSASVSNSGLGYSGESFAAIGGVILPIRWLGFNAVRQVNDGFISWTVENDDDNEKYFIERSLDGSNFVPIGELSKRAGSGIKQYSFIDKNIVTLTKKIVYYRVKSLEVNNRYSYTETKSIRLDTKGEISLYPIPAKDGFTLAVPYLRPNQEKVQLHLVNALGQIVDRKDITRAAAINYYYNLQSSLITSGEYLLKIFEDNQLTETKRVLIKK